MHSSKDNPGNPDKQTNQVGNAHKEQPEYITTSELKKGSCPKCGGGCLSYGSLDLSVDGDMVFYPFTCDDCGANGKEFYALEWIDSVCWDGE